MTYAYVALMTNTWFSNAKNKITQSVCNFCHHGNQTKDRLQLYKDIFKPNDFLITQAYVNYAYSALIINTCFSNARNKITQNVSNFFTMATKQWYRQQFDKHRIFKPKYFLNNKQLYGQCICCLNSERTGDDPK